MYIYNIVIYIYIQPSYLLISSKKFCHFHTSKPPKCPPSLGAVGSVGSVGSVKSEGQSSAGIWRRLENPSIFCPLEDINNWHLDILHVNVHSFEMIVKTKYVDILNTHTSKSKGKKTGTCIYEFVRWCVKSNEGIPKTSIFEVSKGKREMWFYCMLASKLQARSFNSTFLASHTTRIAYFKVLEPCYTPRARWLFTPVAISLHVHMIYKMTPLVLCL